MSTDYRYFPTLAIPGGTMGQVLTKSSNDPDNGAQWLDPSTGIGPTGPAGPAGPVGPPGAAGTPGATGPAGASGTIWLTAALSGGSPAGGTGVVGNFLIDLDSHAVWEKTAVSTWTKRLPGPACFQGSGTPPVGLLAVLGDTYIDNNTNDIYFASGPGSWSIQGRLNVNNLSVSGLFSGGITRDVVLGASAAGWKWTANGTNAFALVVIPFGWSTYALEIALINAAAGNVQINCANVAYVDGSPTSYPAGTSITKTFASTSGDTPEVLTFTGLSCAANAGKLQAIRLQRVSATSTSFVVAGINVRRTS